MVLERTSVGLDVHARSVVAGVLDTVTGELWSLRLPPATDAVLSWVGSLPGPVAVAYEAGPTGFGLARLLVIGELAAMRVLVRAWEDARADLLRARHGLSKLLLCQDWSWREPPGPGP